MKNDITKPRQVVLDLGELEYDEYHKWESIDEFLKPFKDLKKQHPTASRIAIMLHVTGSDYSGHGAYFEFAAQRPETEHEIKTRVERVRKASTRARVTRARRKTAKEAQRRKLYEELKKEFEDGLSNKLPNS